MNGDVALTRNVRVEGAYTLLDRVDRATGLLLPQRHRHQGYLKAEYSNARMGAVASLRGTYFSKWPLNTAAGASVIRPEICMHRRNCESGVQAFGVIDNLADTRDSKLGNPMPSFDRPDYGRTFRIGLRYSFAREND